MGSRIRALFDGERDGDQGGWFDGRVSKVHEDGRVDLIFEDGEKLMGENLTEWEWKPVHTDTHGTPLIEAESGEEEWGREVLMLAPLKA